MKPRIPSAQTIHNQRLASDPTLSAWVSANAGSGKTTVLTRRVIRLLLDGVNPSAILCLTFTKAAAANMQNRIFAQLGQWAVWEDEKLASEIAGITGRQPDIAGLRRARQLFASAIETPGGLKLLTIHAFCERVLHLFPFEANVPAQFSVLDDRAARELLDDARSGLIAQAQAEPDGPLGLALERLVEEAGEGAFDSLLAEITGDRDALRGILAQDGLVRVLPALRGLLDLGPEESVASIDTEIGDGALSASEWPAIEAALRDNDKKTSHALADRFAIAGRAAPEYRSATYREIFLTQAGTLRAEKGFVVSDVTKAYPVLAAEIMDEHARIAGLLERRKAALTLERTQALLTIAGAMLHRYEAGKARRAALDFDDLVQRTSQLLTRAGAEWVLYKLDRGIDHILVDEAQDTSPPQWQIIEKLAQEFTAGDGARPNRRTIFAVGDEKQSIFSFQGAAPAEFARMRRHFRTHVERAEQRFEPIELKQSFRSTRDILSAVDHVFASADNRRGLSSDDVATLHEAVRAEDPGRVEVWPVEKPESQTEIAAWDAPFDTTPVTSPVVRLARTIAAEVARLIRDGDAATGARYHAGDVIVLVRSRNAVFEAIIRALKFANVPVAGADRIVLTDHIAVMDLMALARFTLLPSDDLTLAAVLKSPLIGLDDDDLIELAPGRTGSLWQALEQAGTVQPRYRRAFDRLSVWLSEAAFKVPFAFFADILARDGGRRIVLARFGPEAADALDEFLRIAGDYEAGNTASLQGFLAWLAEAKAEIKRDMDVARSEVRVMTVHGAKGLEARIVILADTCGAPDGRHDPKLFWVQAPGRPSGEKLPIWSPNKAADPPCVSAARDVIHDEGEAEHRRLLYVALTRAEDRLIVAGFEGQRARRPGNWYDMIASALRDAGARIELMPDGTSERLVWEPTPRSMVENQTVSAQDRRLTEPGWLHQPVVQEQFSSVTLQASDAAEPEAAEQNTQTGAPADPRILRRGALVHALLQYLPPIAPVERADRALAFLGRAAAEWPDDHAAWAGEALGVLENPANAQLFGDTSRAEVPLAGRIPRPGKPDYAVTGRIDRLAVLPDCIWIADFKTNRRPPESLSVVPEAYVTQLALYRHLLSQLYPGRPVRAALIWTARAERMELPATMLDAAMAMLMG